MNASTGIELGIKITQVQEDEFCVEFTKKLGEGLDFLNTFKSLQDHINGVTT